MPTHPTTSTDQKDTALEAYLKVFQGIADECTEEELVSIMEDCLESDNPTMRGTVHNIYKSRLEALRRRETEIEHYENLYQQ